MINLLIFIQIILTRNEYLKKFGKNDYEVLSSPCWMKIKKVNFCFFQITSEILQL